jgi:putative copper resistance protein D
MLGIPLDAVDFGALAMVLELPGLGPALVVRAAALSFALWVLVSRHGGIPAVLPSAGVALATLAWSGHAGGSEGASAALHLGSTVLHLWAAGVWLGAIAAFLLMAAAAIGDQAERATLADSLARFHRTGTVVVLLLVASGIANGAMMLGGIPTLASLLSPWGQLMGLKLVAFAVMIGLAALNRFRLAPALAGESISPAAVRRSLWLEFGLAILILGLVAWLGLLSPTGD